MTRSRALLGCTALALLGALGLPALTATAADGTEAHAPQAAAPDDGASDAPEQPAVAEPAQDSPTTSEAPSTTAAPVTTVAETTTTTVAPASKLRHASPAPQAPTTIAAGPTTTVGQPTIAAAATTPTVAQPTIAATVAAAPTAARPVVTAPSAPRSLTATPGNGSVTLVFTAPASNGGAAIDRYLVQRSVNGGAWTNAAFTGGRITLSGLTNGTRYSFRVSAHNSAGYGASSTPVSAIAGSVPSAVRSLTATPGQAQITLRWVAPATNGGLPITSYTISYQAGGSTWKSINVTPRSTYTFSGLSRGGTYSFRVAANNTKGRSAVTPIVTAKTFTTPPPPPPPARRCDPNYSGCVPIASDVDCAGGSGNGPAYVQGPVYVIGYDIYGPRLRQRRRRLRRVSELAPGRCDLRVQLDRRVAQELADL